MKKMSPEKKKDKEKLAHWIARVQASADEIDPEDEIIIENAIREQRRQGRELARGEPAEP